jgi:hypothetical protein
LTLYSAARLPASDTVTPAVGTVFHFTQDAASKKSAQEV